MGWLQYAPWALIALVLLIALGAELRVRRQCAASNAPVVTLMSSEDAARFGGNQ